MFEDLVMGDREIFRIRSSGDARERLTSSPKFDRRPQWSFDGGGIYFETFRSAGEPSIYGMEANGANPFSISLSAARDEDPVPHPFEDIVMFRSDREEVLFEVYIAPGDGSGPVQLLMSDQGRQSFPVGFLPDGTGVFESEGQTYSEGGMFILPAGNPVISPAGDIIVGEDFDPPRLVIGPTTGSLGTPLTPIDSSSTEPAWSPDGTLIAFESDREGGREIFTMNADGTNQTRVTTGGFTNRFPQWSPTGEHLIFHSVRAGVGGIFRMKPDGSELTRLTGVSASFAAPARWQTCSP